MNNTHYNPFNTAGWTYGERFNRSTIPNDYGHLLGPCPLCGSPCYDYGGGWRCRALYCSNNESNPAPNVGSAPEWWNTNIQVKKEGNRWVAFQANNSAFGNTPGEAVNNLKLITA